MPTPVKDALRWLLPNSVRRSWQRHRFAREQAEALNKPLPEVFQDIYERGLWSSADGPRYQSGHGSLPGVTAGYEAFVTGYLERHPSITSLVDVGCGDFQVSSRIMKRLSRPITYIGCDIAANIIKHNEATYGRPGEIEFAQLNVATDPLPPGHLVTVREVFQHLSNDTILAALNNLRRRFKTAIITEAVHIRPDKPNLDIVSGYRTRDALNSGVYLEAAPFNLTILEQFETDASPIEVYRTLVVAL
jgi:SAM-dependent methyltransferase